MKTDIEMEGCSSAHYGDGVNGHESYATGYL